jgi:outer membrane protein TolC
MHRRLYFCLLLSAFCLNSTAQPLRLSLADAVQRALRDGSQAQLARSAEERSRISRNEALQALFPQADARLLRYSQSINLQTFGFTIPGQPPVVGPFNVTDWQLEAAMQLFNLAAIRHYQALSQGESASRYAMQRAENDVATAVARLYVLTQRASTQIASRQSDIALFDRLLKVAQDEFTAGTGTRLDVAQATVQLDRAKQALLIAQNDQRTTLLALLNAIGENLASEVVLVDPLPTAPPVPPLDAALATAQKQRPELKEVEAREKEATLSMSAARARRLPSLGFDFLGDYSGNHSTDLLWSRRVAATLGMPLFRADINAAVARARADLHDREIERTQRQRDVEQDVRRAVMALENANARVAVATQSARVAEEALTVAQDRRQAGYGSPVEVDRAQDSYRQAREDLIAAQADAAAAQYDLQHATGDIRKLVEGTR